MKEKLVFYSILDFFPRRYEIKKIYDTLSLNDKKLYKNFVYSMCFTKEDVKDLIWEYLNDYEYSYEKLIQEYFIRRRKQNNASIKDSTDNIDISNTDGWD